MPAAASCQLLGGPQSTTLPLPQQAVKTPSAVVSKVADLPAAVPLFEAPACWLALFSETCTQASSLDMQQDHESLFCSSIVILTQLLFVGLLQAVTVDWFPRPLPSSLLVIASASI